MMNKVRSLVLSLFTAIWLSCSFVCAQAIADPKESESELAASLFSGLIENNQSLVSFDVTFETEVTTFRPSGQLTIRQMKARYVSAGESGRFLFALASLVDTISENKDMESQNAVVAYYGDASLSIHAVDERGHRDFRLGRDDTSKKSRLHIPGFHSLGIVAFPHFEQILTADDPYWKKLTIPDRDSTAKIHGSGHATLVSTAYDGDDPRIQVVWRFDLETLLPNKRTTYYFHTETGQRALKEIEDYQWQESSGVYVPTKIRCEVKQISRDADSGKLLNYSVVSDTQFRWTAVNEDIPDERFDWSTLKSTNDIYRILENAEASK